MKKIISCILIIGFGFAASSFLAGCMAQKELSPPPPAKKQPAYDPTSAPVKLPPKTSLARKSKQQKITTDQIESKLWLAKKYLGEGKYKEVPAITTEILTVDPGNRMATELTNAAYYHQGKEFAEADRYVDAMAMLDKVDPGYRDVNRLTAAVKRRMAVIADRYYKQGVQYFVEEELAKAIRQWEKTLLMAPDHYQARKNIENAKHLLEELEKIEE